MFPELGQGIRALFNELNSTGKTHIDQAFPVGLLKGKPDKQSGVVRLDNGSILQVGGFDSIERYIGSGPSVVVMSEAATSVHAERAWQLVQPILLNNNGIAIFPYTPRGAGFGKDLYDMAVKSPDWHCTKLTVDDTKIILPDGKRLLDEVQRSIIEGEMDHDFAQQEFWCSFTAPNTGVYYARQLETAEREGRITAVPHDPGLPVYTWWDIGTHDSTAIWFAQAHRGGELRLIDYYEASGQSLSHYLDVLNTKRMQGWAFEPRGQLVPHDFGNHEFSTGMTRMQHAQQMGWRMTVVPRPVSVEDGIDAVRRVLPRCWFDRERCAAGLVHLREYTKQFSKALQMFTGPKHDVHSDSADAFRTGIIGMKLAGMHVAKNVTQAQREGRMGGGPRPVVVATDFSVWR
jgi:phage terminase large subunit